jgi:hypothetical protein
MISPQPRTHRSWWGLAGAGVSVTLASMALSIAGLGCQPSCHTSNDFSTGPDHTPWTVDVAGFASVSCTAAFSSSSATVTYSFLPVAAESGATDASLSPGDGGLPTGPTVPAAEACDVNHAPNTGWVMNMGGCTPTSGGPPVDCGRSATCLTIGIESSVDSPRANALVQLLGTTHYDISVECGGVALFNGSGDAQYRTCLD